MSGRARHIVVAAGAGISTGAGIPDFRSPGTGLYDNLQKYNLPNPMAIFDTAYFRQNPAPFFEVAASMVPGSFQPTAVHFFLSLLERKGIMERVLTQNIDGLERQAGLSADRIIECHGRFYTAHCLTCGKAYEFEQFKDDLRTGKVLRCECGGLIKPDLVFFGDQLPSEFHTAVPRDLSVADLLIVAGTSLLVQPFASVISLVRPNVPRLFVNLTEAGVGQEAIVFENGRLADANDVSGQFKFGHLTNTRDVFAGGDCEVSVFRLAKLLGWDDELFAMLPDPVRKRVLKAVSEAVE
jgi:NAD-dependent deacetylase sirtuin 2